MLPIWNRIGDCVRGEEAVKAKGETYLPKPTANDGEQPAKIASRYAEYKLRAMFYGATGRTLKGMIGEVFRRDSTYDMPDKLKELLPNVDGAGRSAEQVAKKVLKMVLSFGRAGLLADYPNMQTPEGQTAPTTAKDLIDQNVRPRLICYEPDTIINWRVMSWGALSLLAVVVLREENLHNEDTFEEVFNHQYRVLRLTKDRQYTVEIWRQPSAGAAFTLAEGPYIAKDHNGKPFNQIPFTFVGSEDNSPDPNDPPMDALSSVNLAHYRNSAEYEDSVAIVGQPTLFISGMTEDWAKNVLKGKVRFGARSVVPLEQGSTAVILQAAPNTLVKEAMDDKVALMKALGAQLVEEKSVQQTATESMQNGAASTSVLGTSAKNTSDALSLGFKWMGMFIGALATEEKPISYDLNTDFDIMRMTPQEQAQTIASWQAEMIDYEEARYLFKRGGIAYKDDQDVKDANEKDRESLLGVTTVAGRVAPDPTVDPITGVKLPDPNKIQPPAAK
jgi:hypothetical protein